MNNWSQQLLTFSKNLNNLNEKEKQKVVFSKARDLSRRKSSHSHTKIIILCELVGELLNDTGLSELEILQVIRLLIEKGKLIQVEDCALVSFVLRRNISEFEDRQQRLQIAWLAADEISTLAILAEEKKELEGAAVLRLEHEEQEQKSRIRKRRRDHNQALREEGRFRY